MAKLYSTAIDLRFSDFDIYGHVNSVVYFSYLETARVKLFRDAFRELSARGIFIVVGSAACDYRLPILPDDPVQVTAWIARLGNSSFDLEYRIHDGGERTFATARTTMVCFDSVNNVAVPMPESLRTLA
jgi:acyl-CoA thioester hydrolase